MTYLHGKSGYSTVLANGMKISRTEIPLEIWLGYGFLSWDFWSFSPQSVSSPCSVFAVGHTKIAIVFQFTLEYSFRANSRKTTISDPFARLDKRDFLKSTPRIPNGVVLERNLYVPKNGTRQISSGISVQCYDCYHYDHYYCRGGK